MQTEDSSLCNKLSHWSGCCFCCREDEDAQDDLYNVVDDDDDEDIYGTLVDSNKSDSKPQVITQIEVFGIWFCYMRHSFVMFEDVIGMMKESNCTHTFLTVIHSTSTNRHSYHLYRWAITPWWCRYDISKVCRVLFCLKILKKIYSSWEFGGFILHLKSWKIPLHCCFMMQFSGSLLNSAGVKGKSLHKLWNKYIQL